MKTRTISRQIDLSSRSGKIPRDQSPKDIVEMEIIPIEKELKKYVIEKKEKL